jgi:type IV pilus assembly protein PilM
MSFWEDRFVSRPHASAAPADSPGEAHGPDLAETREPEAGQPEAGQPEVGHTWSYGSEPAEAAPAEHVESEPEHAESEPEHVESEPEHVESEPVHAERELPEVTESEDRNILEDDAERWAEAAAAVELDEAAPVRYERRGLFRRRTAVPVEAVEHEHVENESAYVESETFEAESAEANQAVGSASSWSYVADEGTSGYAEPEHAVEADEPADTEADESPADEILADETSAPEYQRRGLFRRRKPVVSEPEHESEETFAESDEDAGFPGNGAWSYVESEPAEAEHGDEVAAAVETEETSADESLADETSAPEYQRRGLFRRRKPVVSESEDSAEIRNEDTEPGDDWSYDPDQLTSSPAESVEDGAFENVPFYDRPEAVEDEISVAQSHEADFVMGEHDDEAEHAVADEPESVPEPEPSSDEPEHEPELESESVEEVVPDLPVATGETEPESPSEHEDDHFTADPLEPVVLRKRSGGGSSRGKKVVGLKVGASQIAAAVVASSGDEPALVDLARRSLEQGVVVDGELRDPEALAHALKTFFKDHGLPNKNVQLGLSSSRVGVRTFDISGIEDESRFDNAVRFKAHEVLPVAAHESVLDYRVVEERYTESGEISRRVLLVVAPRDQVEPYIEACRIAGLRLAGVDLEAFGLLRAFVPPLGTRSRSEDSATVVVAIGHEASTLLVAGGGVCEFTRVFDWGGGALQAAIAEELEVPLMEAATILTHLSLSGPGRHLDSLDADTRGRALEAVRGRLTPFARELVSSLQFYQTQPESLGIREILITGGTSHLEGLADALHQMIGVSVSVGDPLARVAVQTDIPVALDAAIGSLAVPIGLAIEDEAARSVNLLPKDARQTRKPPNVLAFAAPIAAAVPLFALGFLFVQANGTAGDRQAELDVVRAQITALPEPTRPNIDPALAGEQAARATAVAQVLGGRLTWERVLGDIARVLPSGVSLTELSATTPQPTTPEPAPTTEDTASSSTPAPAAPPSAVPSTPTGVTVSGYTLDYSTVARTLARIQAVPSLTNAQLQSATPTVTAGKKRIIEFTIVADLATPGGAQ